MFIQRLISGVCLLAVLAACLVLGDNVLLAFSIFISFLGFYEMVKATSGSNDKKQWRNGLVNVGACGILVYYIVLALCRQYEIISSSATLEVSMLCITVTILAILVVYVFGFPKYHATQVMSVIFAFLYVPVMISYIYQTRCLEDGIYLVWLIFISSWMCDTSAYVVGMLIGKHKMAPKLSPKKSIEGGIGGIVGAALLGLLYGVILRNAGVADGANLYVYPVIAGVGGLISQIGDLAASAVKRNYDIKDYGRLIPGHGGILDRFDSVIFTAPMIYYLSVLLLK